MQIETDRANRWPLATSRFDNNLAALLTLLLGEPAALVGRLAPILDLMDFSKAGPPLTDRRAKLRELDASIGTLAAEIASVEASLGADPAAAEAPPERPSALIAGPDVHGKYRVARWGQTPGSEHLPGTSAYVGWQWERKLLDRAEVDALLAAGAEFEDAWKARRKAA